MVQRNDGTKDVSTEDVGTKDAGTKDVSMEDVGTKDASIEGIMDSIQAGRKSDVDEWVQATGKKELQGRKLMEGTSGGMKVAQDEDTLSVEADKLLGKFEMIPPLSPAPLEMETKD